MLRSFFVSFSLLIFGSVCFAQNSMIFQALDRDALFVIHTNDVSKLVDSIRDTGVLSSTSLKKLFEELDQLANAVYEEDAANKETFTEQTGTALNGLLGDGSLTLAVFQIDGRFEIAVINQYKQLNKKELVHELTQLRNGFDVICAIVQGQTKAGRIEETQRQDIRKTTESDGIVQFEFVPGRVHASSIYCANIGKEFSVLSTSKTLAIETVARLESPQPRNLDDDRMFRETVGKMEQSKADGMVWAYVNPRLINQHYSIDEALTFDLLLPDFYEEVSGVRGANDLAGMGVRMQILTPSKNTDKEIRKPKVIIDGFVRTALPRKDVLAVLETTKPIAFPPLDFEKETIEYLLIQNLDFAKLYQSLGRSFEAKNVGKSWRDQERHLQEKYKNSFAFSELFSKMGSSHVKVWQRVAPGEIESYSFLQFADSEGARWYAEKKSQSGFVNQTFPHSLYQRGEFEYFKRSKESVTELTNKISAGSNKDAYLAANEWMVTCSPERIEQVADAFGINGGLPENVAEVLENTKAAAGVNKDPFYLEFKSAYRWAGEAANLKRYLDFREDYADKPGTYHIQEPKSFIERLLMTTQYYGRQAMIEELGDTISFVTLDNDSVRFTIGCFAPAAKSVGPTVSSLRKYAPGLKD